MSIHDHEHRNTTSNSKGKIRAVHIFKKMLQIILNYPGITIVKVKMNSNTSN